MKDKGVRTAQHNGTQHSHIQNYDTQDNTAIMSSVVMLMTSLIYCHAECNFSEWHYADDIFYLLSR